MISGDAWSVFVLLGLVILWAYNALTRDRQDDERRKSIEYEIFKPAHARGRDILLNLMIEGYESGPSLADKLNSTFPTVQTTHPPWQVGQHVSYFNEDNSGRWTAIKIQVAGRTDKGIWILSADFKTASGECTILLSSDPRNDAKAPFDLGLIRQEAVHQWSTSDEMDLYDDPSNKTSMAFSLLEARKNPDAIAAQKTPPRAVRYPCNIGKVHRYTMDLKIFLKHHDLNPRVYVTGVACLITERDNKENSFTATAFGQYKQSNAAAAPYNDYVDFSHSKRIEHGSFSLKYPATWFLRPRETGDKRGMEEQSYMVLSGGSTCSCMLSVWIRRGSRNIIASEHLDALARLSNPLEEGQMVPEPAENRLKGAKTDYFVSWKEEYAIYNLSHTALVLDTTHERVASIFLIGWVPKRNPRFETIIGHMSELFPGVINSFCFIPEDDTNTSTEIP